MWNVEMIGVLVVCDGLTRPLPARRVAHLLELSTADEYFPVVTVYRRNRLPMQMQY